MNFALGSILVILILLPGFILRKGYYSYPFSKRFIPENLFTDLIYSITPAFILHIIYFIIVNKCADRPVDLTLIGNLLANTSDSKIIDKCYFNVSENAIRIFFYNSGLFAIAYSLGHIGR